MSWIVSSRKNRWRDVYVEERDEWMVGQLQARMQLCRDTAAHIDSIVCVVGRDHLPGMISLWESGLEIGDDRMEQLMDTAEGYQLPQHSQEHKNNIMLLRHAGIGFAATVFIGFHTLWIWDVCTYT